MFVYIMKCFGPDNKQVHTHSVNIVFVFVEMILGRVQRMRGMNGVRSAISHTSLVINFSIVAQYLLDITMHV